MHLVGAKRHTVRRYLACHTRIFADCLGDNQQLSYTLHSIRNDATHHEAHVLHKDGKRGYEPQGFAVHHGTRQHCNDAELLRPRYIPFCTGRNGQTESGSQRGEHGGSQGCCLVVSRYFTTCSTTFHRENMRGYESICEFLPIWKTPGNPEVTGYTGI